MCDHQRFAACLRAAYKCRLEMKECPFGREDYHRHQGGDGGKTRRMGKKMETQTRELDTAFKLELEDVSELLSREARYPVFPFPYRNNYFIYPTAPKPIVKNVIFNNPATIVYWYDGTKTVVKCDQRDTYSKEAGLALCYMKKMLGSSRAFNDVLKEWTDHVE